MDYFKPDMTQAQINQISMLGLAHIGDGVYELMTRAALCEDGHTAVAELHQLATRRVNAPAEEDGWTLRSIHEKLLPALTEEEAAIYRRGRNAHVNSVPRAANIGQYHAATGLEALFGWLYLQGKCERLNELFRLIQSQDK